MAVISFEETATVALERVEVSLSDRDFEAARRAYDSAFRICNHPDAELPSHIYNRLSELENELLYR